MIDEYEIAASMEREILDKMFGGRRPFHLPMFDGENADDYFTEFESQCEAMDIGGEEAKALFYCLCHWDIQLLVMDILAAACTPTYERLKAEILLCSKGASRGGPKSMERGMPSDFWEEHDPFVWRMRCMLFWRRVELKTKKESRPGAGKFRRRSSKAETGSCELPLLT